MIQVIPRLSDAAGNLPRYGDGDDGRAVQLQDHWASRTDWLYELGRDLLGVTPRTSLRSTLAGTTVRTFLPTKPVSEVHEIQRPRGSDHLEEAGFYLLTSSRWTVDEVFVLADAGPLGFLSIAAHGHADALSVALSVGGRPILVDPGTYTYYADRDARRYFRGTSAHNTLIVDGRDQSIQEGPMLWGRRAEVRVLSWEPRENGGVLTAEHNGYRALGLTHRRHFCLSGRTLVIEDLLIGSATGPRMVDLRYHLHPSCSVRMTEGNAARIECDMIGVKMVFSDFLEVTSIRAGSDGGWYSPAFSKREATTTLSARAVASPKTRLQTTIEVEVA
jgi:hypothetical protein